MSNTILINDISINGQGNTPETLSKTLQENTVNALGVDASSRTIWVNGQPYGNAYVNITDNGTVEAPLGAEIFNDFANNVATGQYSHAEGNGTTANGKYSHAECNGTAASGESSHAEGGSTTATGNCSHAEGGGTTASGLGSHAEGVSTNIANLESMKPVGDETPADAITRTWSVEKFNLAHGEGSHVEGKDNLALGEGSHAEGYITTAKGNYSHAEGTATTAAGEYSHTEGAGTTASGLGSHAEGSSMSKVDLESIEQQEGDEKFEDAIIRTWTNGVGENKLKFSLAFGNSAHVEGKDNLALGFSSHAEGYATKSIGANSHAEGINTLSTGNSAHAEGTATTAIGHHSHSEGSGTTAKGGCSHAEGSSSAIAPTIEEGDITDGFAGLLDKWYRAESTARFSLAFGEASHVEGLDNLALGDYSHAEGHYTKAPGKYSHAEGSVTTAAGEYSHTEGAGTTAEGYGSHAEGTQTMAKGNCSHAEGFLTTATKNCSHAEGKSSFPGYINKDESFDDILAKWEQNAFSLAFGEASHVEGLDNLALGDNSHAEGVNTKAIGNQSHAEGSSTTAEGESSHAEGNGTTAKGDNSHAEGDGGHARGDSSHAEGYQTIANGLFSHAEGWSSFRVDLESLEKEDGETDADAILRTWTDASIYKKFSLAHGTGSHVEGKDNLSLGEHSHAEGLRTKATGYSAHTEGNSTTAEGGGSHAEGYLTKAVGDCSHAEGENTTAAGDCSHTEGFGTITTLGNDAEHAQGRYNASNTNTIHSVGIGTNVNNRKNAHEILNTGEHYIFNLGGYDGTNPADSKDLATILSTVDESDTNGFNVEKTLTVTGETTLNDKLSITKNGLGVSGDSQFSGNVAIGSTGANKTLTVYGNIKGETNSYIGGCLNIGLGALDTTYTCKVNGTLNVTGNSTLNTLTSSTIKSTSNIFTYINGDSNAVDGDTTSGLYMSNRSINSHVGGSYKRSLISFSGNLNTDATQVNDLTEVKLGSYCRLTIGSEKYPSLVKGDEGTDNWGLDCNNSDIVGVNSISFNDTAENATEGILFKHGNADTDVYSSIWVSGAYSSSVPKFSRNVRRLVHQDDRNITDYDIYYSGASLIPKTSSSYDIGSTNNKFKNLYLSGASTIGGNSTVGGNLIVSGVGNSTFGGSVSITSNLSVTNGYGAFGSYISAFNSFVLNKDYNNKFIDASATNETFKVGLGTSSTLTFKGITTFNDGSVTINDNAYADGFYENSDATKKDIVSNLDIDFDKLKQIPKVNFIWKNDTEKKNNIGTIAQELNKVYPELVNGEEGNMTVDYAKLSIIALAAIDKLEDRIKHLEDKLYQYENKLI